MQLITEMCSCFTALKTVAFSSSKRIECKVQVQFSKFQRRAVSRYQNIVTNTEKKKYDVLDHRKAEFDSDHRDFCLQVDALQQTLQEFLDTWFGKPLSTEYMLGGWIMTYFCVSSEI